MRETGPAPRKNRIVFGLRLKITLTFLLAGSVLSGLLAYTVFRILEMSLLNQMQARVLDLARMGSTLVDVGALSRLAAGLSPDPSPGQVDRIEGSADFRLVSDQLNRIRAVESRLAHFIYIFAPTRDPNTALYVVDGDVLAARAGADTGAPISSAVSHYNSQFDLTDLPVARRVLAEKSPLVEDSWSYDPSFNVNSITGYAPLLGPTGGLIGALGIDMVDTDVRLILSNATTTVVIVTAAALLLTLAASILLGTLFSRGIVSLEGVVRSFDQNSFNVRAKVRTHDEVGRLAQSFNALADTVQQYGEQQAALLSAYGRFVPHELLRLLGKKSILDVRLGDQTEREMTILFSDIVSFTSLSESMSPFENFNFINSYLRRMGPQISTRGGFIDKYIGDGIMALFPERPDDALRAAVGMQTTLVEYNGHRRNSGYRPIAIGVGVHAGRLMLGTVGEDRRMDGSVISDAVNLCSRLQGLTRIYGSAILTTGATLKMLKEPARFRCRFIDRVHVRGRKETVLLFEVLDGEPREQREKKLAYRSDLAKALRLYFARDFAAARDIVTRLLQQNPEDEVLRIYRKRSELLVNLGAPEGWQGVEEIDAR
ncbi:MAG: adenylate/guanylate cyclase domain-containing protein [Spirochaetia bacterium]|jgi:class 3 adenylate cyclase